MEECRNLTACVVLVFLLDLNLSIICLLSFLLMSTLCAPG